MNTVFNDLEAARIAVEIEKNGAHFYRTAEKIVQDPAMKEEPLPFCTTPLSELYVE